MHRIRVPPVLLGWPRRAAAAICFVLAALSAVAPSHHSSPAARPRAVPAGYVTTTAAVYADGLTFVRPGDRIDLVAPPAGDAAGAVTDTAATVIAHGVEVLAVRAGRDATADAPVSQVLLAAPRDIAVRIAAHQGAQVLAAVTLPP